jgi:hypothetical protein
MQNEKADRLTEKWLKQAFIGGGGGGFEFAAR